MNINLTIDAIEKLRIDLGSLPAWPADIAQKIPKVAIAEDDDDIRLAISSSLRREGFDVIDLPDGEAMMHHLANAEDNNDLPDVIVIDHQMPGCLGLEILESVRSSKAELSIIMVTAFGADIVDIAHAYGANAVFQKPFDMSELKSAVYANMRWPTSLI